MYRLKSTNRSSSPGRCRRKRRQHWGVKLRRNHRFANYYVFSASKIVVIAECQTEFTIPDHLSQFGSSSEDPNPFQSYELVDIQTATKEDIQCLRNELTGKTNRTNGYSLS